MKSWKSGIVCGVFGLVGLSMSAAFGSVPKNVTDDTALYQNLSEIKVSKSKELDFDRDIARLASSEGRYQERLPRVTPDRIRAPMQRISQQKYRYSVRH